jgi:hypothetical protein
VKRALLAAATLAGCSLHDPHVTGSPCTSTPQCATNNICFLGECRPPGSSLSVVKADVRPPSGSPFGAQQIDVDLHLSPYKNFDLGSAVIVPGTVTQQPGAPIAGAVVTLTSQTRIIPDRVDQVVAVTDANGAFRAVHVPPGSWDVVVTGPAGSALPPYRPPSIDTATIPPSFDVVLPQGSSLVSLQGVLLANGTAALPGAAVTAIDGSRVPISAPALSQSDGSFTLSLLPGTTQASLLVGPALNVSGSSTTAPDPLPSYDPVTVPVPVASPLVVPLPDSITIQGRVMDLGHNPVPSAVVYARSTTPGWMLARSAATNADGTWSLTLRAGTYLLEAAPSSDPSTPALSAQLTLSLSSSTIVSDFVCRPKVRRYGLVVGPDGRPVKNAQVIATRVSDFVVPARTAYTVPTDATGVYHVVADPGTWQFELVPPADSNLPRSIVRVSLDATNLGEDPLPTIAIPRALGAFGLVRGMSGQTATPIEGATVSFYSLDSTGRQSVFLGSGLTNASGAYIATLPDVVDPSAGP